MVLRPAPHIFHLQPTTETLPFSIHGSGPFLRTKNAEMALLMHLPNSIIVTKDIQIVEAYCRFFVDSALKLAVVMTVSSFDLLMVPYSSCGEMCPLSTINSRSPC